jgi:hypothetical protein
MVVEGEQDGFMNAEGADLPVRRLREGCGCECAWQAPRVGADGVRRMRCPARPRLECVRNTVRDATWQGAVGASRGGFSMDREKRQTDKRTAEMKVVEGGVRMCGQQRVSGRGEGCFSARKSYAGKDMSGRQGGLGGAVCRFGYAPASWV